MNFRLVTPTEILVFNGLAKVDALWRLYQNGFIITLSISNNQHIEEDQNDPKSFNRSRNTQTLFEVEFKCIVDSGHIGEYLSKDKSLLTDEDKELELRYKDEKIYAVGHGAAVDWERNIKEEMELWIDFSPQSKSHRLLINDRHSTRVC